MPQHGQKNYDLIFLDIQMEGLDGVEAGNQIRTLMENEIVQIVYISSSKKYAMELFQSRPMDFLIKPLRAENVLAAVKKAQKITRKQKTHFEYWTKNGFIRLEIKNILYFESHKKQLRVVCFDGVHEYYGNLNEAENQLKTSGQFLRIHKSYPVNSENMQAFKRQAVILINGQELPISQVNQTRIY